MGNRRRRRESIKGLTLMPRYMTIRVPPPGFEPGISLSSVGRVLQLRYGGVRAAPVRHERRGGRSLKQNTSTTAKSMRNVHLFDGGGG